MRAELPITLPECVTPAGQPLIPPIVLLLAQGWAHDPSQTNKNQFLSFHWTYWEKQVIFPPGLVNWEDGRPGLPASVLHHVENLLLGETIQEERKAKATGEIWIPVTV